MKPKPLPRKTAAIRAAELFKLVNGYRPLFVTEITNGWLKLGKMVLRLERKWTALRAAGKGGGK